MMFELFDKSRPDNLIVLNRCYPARLLLAILIQCIIYYCMLANQTCFAAVRNILRPRTAVQTETINAPPKAIDCTNNG